MSRKIETQRESAHFYYYENKVTLFFEDPCFWNWLLFYFDGFTTDMPQREIKHHLNLRVYRSQEAYRNHCSTHCPGAQETSYEGQRLTMASGQAHSVVCLLIDDVNEAAKYVPIRLLRSMLVEVCTREEYLFLHASSVEKDGFAIVLIGDKFSGKTTSMLRLLLDGEFNFLTNDKILYHTKKDELHALPYSVGIRNGTIKSISSRFEKQIMDRLATFQHYQIPKVVQNTEPDKERVFLLPSELAEATHVGLSTCARPVLVLQPRYVPSQNEIEAKRLEPAAAFAAIQDSIIKGTNFDAGMAIATVPTYQIAYNDSSADNFVKKVKQWFKYCTEPNHPTRIIS